ncbi:MAG TPA: TMEM175 family protein [Candidatus Eisenbacteria bacterium]
MAAEREHQVVIRSVELERLIFFSDAVFAIAITILVLDLRPPEVSGPDPAGSLRHGLIRLIPKLMSYAMSFWIIGLYWFVHHRIFRHIRRCDDGLIWLNLLFLFSIAFLPFPVALMGSYGALRAAVVFYTATLIVTGIAQLLLWRHASRGAHLIDPDFDPREARFITVRSAVAPLAALLVLGLAFVVPPYLATVGFFLIFPLQRWLRRRHDRASRPAPAPARPRRR